MTPNLTGTTVAVAGGDARYLVLVEELLAAGARVKVTGLPVKKGSSSLVYTEDLTACLAGVDAVVLPILGIDDQGRLHCVQSEQTLILTEAIMATLSADTLIFTGLAGTLLKQLTARLGLRLIELMNLDEVAILNSIPSAEGAVQMAMEMLPVTVHGSTAVVLGFGRTGKTLARLLSAMGARTAVAARKNADLARITEMNLTPVTYDELTDYLGKADVIFNTVPALVLPEEVLTSAAPGTVIIDLATAPGGTDFSAAERLGIEAVLAPSLPGRVAPKTAGRILARAIVHCLVEVKAGN